MQHLPNTRILIGITGGIAAYKTPELVRLCQQQGAEVRAVMTTAAKQFITPLTLQTVTGHPVIIDLFSPEADNGMDHIAWARWADVLLIAPATANSIAKMAQGQADDLLGTLYLAARCPVFLAPSMNTNMWHHPTTQRNLQSLRNDDVRIIGPENGEQACGDVGLGRMTEPHEIVQTLSALLPRQYDGESTVAPRILITAGPTFEDIDPVRFIGNRSSGKMGYALARQAQLLGAQVTLVSGPVSLTAPSGIPIHRVRTADEMQQQVMACLPEHEIFISAAAVSDYAPTTVTTKKIKKTENSFTLSLNKTVDIAKTAAATKKIFVVGFAAETEHLEENALKKLNKKKMNMIVANPVGPVGTDTGMDSDANQATVYWKGGQQAFSKIPKTELAKHLIKLILDHYHEKNTA